MRDKAIETIEKDGFKAEIFQDTDPCESPREWDNLGTMVCFHRRYNLGDEQPKKYPEEWLAELAGKLVNADDYEKIPAEHIQRIIEKHCIMIPLGLYDHSGLHMYIGGGSHPFDCGGWDSGTVGYIYVTRERVIKEYGDYSDGSKAKATAVLKAEVETYDQYLTGDVYGYVVTGIDGGREDSCWGFYGLDHVTEEAKSILEWAVKNEAEQAESINQIMHL